MRIDLAADEARCGPARCLAFGAQGRLLAVGFGTSVVVFEAGEGGRRFEHAIGLPEGAAAGPVGEPSDVALSADGSTLAACVSFVRSDDGARGAGGRRAPRRPPSLVAPPDAFSGALLYPLGGRPRAALPFTAQYAPRGARFSPDGATLLVGGPGLLTLQWWQVATGRKLAERSAGSAWPVAFSPGGAFGAALNGEFIFLWAADFSGRVLAAPRHVQHVAVGDDGSVLAARAGRPEAWHWAPGAERPRKVRVRDAKGLVGALWLAPAADAILFARVGGGAARLCLGGELVELERAAADSPAPSGGSAYAVSEDGRWLAVLVPGAAYVTELVGARSSGRGP
jgi:hypothetical protein